MQLRNIKAAPHPNGNRANLRWLVPQPGQVDGVRIMRGESTYPRSFLPGPAAGKVWVADVDNKILFSVDPGAKDELDKNTLPLALVNQFLANQIALPAHTPVSVTQSGRQWQIEHGEDIYIIVNSGASLDVYGVHRLEDTGLRAETVYYYAFFPYRGESREYLLHRENRVSVMVTGAYDFAGRMMRMLPSIYHRYDTGQLRAFLDLPGGQFDQLYSFARAALNVHDIDSLDGKLLPLLAQWIGWTIDSYNPDIEGRRGELKKVPALYEAVGIIPAMEAAIAKTIGGWNSRTKEFLHNVFLSNSPERLNLWTCHRDSPGLWRESEEVFSLDDAYDGRPAAAVDETGTLWLFYHTQRNQRWDIRMKTGKKNHEGITQWSPSLSFTRSGNIDKFPCAALQGEDLWVFWSSYNETRRAWEIQYRKRTRSQGNWTDMDALEEGDTLPAGPNPRKSPQAVVDGQNRLWLFWLEKTRGIWRPRYNRHDGQAWESNAVDFPDQDGETPRVGKDLFVLHEPGQGEDGGGIYLFWSQKQQVNGTRGRRQIAWRRKSGTLSLEDGWENVNLLDKIPVSQVVTDIDYDDIEPSAIIDKNNQIEFFWVSNRSGRNWALCSVYLKDIQSETHLENTEIVTNNPYSRRAPLPLTLDGELVLVYRSNRSITYQSERYRATTTTDFRYAGCLTADTRNQARHARRGMYDDFRTYTYDTGPGGAPTNNDWYARDAIGVYLTPPDTEDARSLTDKQEIIKDILARFLPIQSRAVFVLEPPIYSEKIYTYDFPEEKDPRLIGELFFDSGMTHIYPGISEEYYDKAPAWTWIRSWKEEPWIKGQWIKGQSGHYSVDFTQSPVNTTFRTSHIAIKSGEEDE
jgi:hypothetical protein